MGATSRRAGPIYETTVVRDHPESSFSGALAGATSVGHSQPCSFIFLVILMTGGYISGIFSSYRTPSEFYLALRESEYNQRPKAQAHRGCRIWIDRIVIFPKPACQCNLKILPGIQRFTSILILSINLDIAGASFSASCTIRAVIRARTAAFPDPDS